MRLGILLVILIIGLSSCEHEPILTNDDCELSTVSFSLTIKGILQTHCESCHNANNPQGNVLLTTYDEVLIRVNDGSLYGSVNHDTAFTAMPYQMEQLDSCKIKQIKKWIDDGAPNN